MEHTENLHFEPLLSGNCKMCGQTRFRRKPGAPGKGLSPYVGAAHHGMWSHLLSLPHGWWSGVRQGLRWGAVL